MMYDMLNQIITNTEYYLHIINDAFVFEYVASVVLVAMVLMLIYKAYLAFWQYVNDGKFKTDISGNKWFEFDDMDPFELFFQIFICSLVFIAVPCIVIYALTINFWTLTIPVILLSAVGTIIWKAKKMRKEKSCFDKLKGDE